MVDYYLWEIYLKFNYVLVMEGVWIKNVYWNVAIFYIGFWKFYEKMGYVFFFKYMVDWGKWEWFILLKYDFDIVNNYFVVYIWLEMYQEIGNKVYLEFSLMEFDCFMCFFYEECIEWWWCDVFFMVLLIFVLVIEIIGDFKYFDFMYEKWV